MDHILIDGRSSTCLKNVKVNPGAIISTSETLVNGEPSGHRAVVATLHCRLQAKPGNVLSASYIRTDCLKKDIQLKIQSTLTADAIPNQLANQALDKAGYFGIDSQSTDSPPQIHDILPSQLMQAADNLVELGEFALLAAASAHAPSYKKEKLSKKPYTTEPTRQMSLLKDCVLHTRIKIRTLGQNTLLRAAFETVRAWRSLRLHLRGASKGTRGIPVPLKMRARLG